MTATIWVAFAACMCTQVATALGQAVASSVPNVPVLTVCQVFHDLGQYNGKAIIVVGRLGNTDGGSWLSQECNDKILTDGYTWDNIISTTYARSEVEPPPELPKGFTWDRRLLRSKLKDVQKTTKLRVLKEYNYSDHWVAIFGRFETQVPLQVALDGGGTPEVMALAT